MNKRLISYILGWVLLVEGASMQLSTAVGLIYREWHFMKYFFYVGVALIILGVLLVFKKPKNNVMHLKDGFAATALSWILLSVAGCLPLWWSRVIPHFVDAVFETVSGFTTTGATILREIEHLPRCMLFWRSFSHFLGGMGVVVFLLAIIPRLGGTQNINLMKAESTGPSVSKSMPKLRNYAALLYGIYGGLTVVECVLLLCGGMNIFDAVTTSFSTAGTGGFMVYNDSMARFSPYLQTVVAVFMMLFGVNFYVYIAILYRRFKQALKNEELRDFLLLILGSVLVIAFALWRKEGFYFRNALHDAFFNVAALISTTGFGTADFTRWPEICKWVLILLMFCGGCAGSTGGGIKLSRIMILFKSAIADLKRISRPRNVVRVQLDGQRVENETIRATYTFISLYFAQLLLFSVLLSLDGTDVATCFTASLSCLSNVGPGMTPIIGPAGNFAFFSVRSKLLLSLAMLLGRLEFYPILVLLMPRTWRR